ncbi:hypothetical protein GC194_03175 [bacterium]|nr:hypothetical protein [bacterium]
MRKFGIIILAFITACVSPKQMSLFDEPSDQKAPSGINGFYATTIYSDYLTDEIWVSPESKCLSIETSKEIKHWGQASLHLKWDKMSQSCGWLGMGIGWDGWNGKNLKPVLYDAAIFMYVRTAVGSRPSLPLAACLEDYNGRQAWLGFGSNTQQDSTISEEWSYIVLPISEFNWYEQNCDIENIKQLIIQFEAEGDVYIDDIRIGPYKGSFKKRLRIPYQPAVTMNIDGSLSKEEWYKIPSVARLDDRPLYMRADNDSFYLYYDSYNVFPHRNHQTGDEIWDGDALELAFSTEETAGVNRTYLRSTDQHIGISISENPIIWDWQQHRELSGCRLVVSHDSHLGLTSIEAALPWSAFGKYKPKPGVLYGFEMALDIGNGSERVKQVRWNEANNDKFYENPSLWGEMVLIEE